MDRGNKTDYDDSDYETVLRVRKNQCLNLNVCCDYQNLQYDNNVGGSYLPNLTL